MAATILMVMGESGSGKSTLETALVERYPDSFTKVVSHTTRPMRDGEVDGVDYHYISQDKFTEMNAQSKFVQITEFAGNFYGSTHADYMNETKITVLSVVPESAAKFIPVIDTEMPDVKNFILYFDISDAQKIKNMQTRGDTPEAIKTRIAVDDLRNQMESHQLQPDFIVTDSLLNNTLPARVEAWIKAQI